MRLNSTRWQQWILILLGFLVLAFFSAGDCSGSDSCYPPMCGGGGGETTQSEYQSKVTATPVAVASGMQNVSPLVAYLPGDTLHTRLSGTWEGEGSGNFTWYPPSDSSNFQFPVGLLPEPGGPPFVFKNISKSEAGTGFVVTYDAPSYRPYNEETFVEAVEVQSGEKTSISEIYHDWADDARQVQPLDPAVLQVNLPSTDPVAQWAVRQFTDVTGPLTQPICEQMVELFQSGQNFAVLRVPLADGPLAPETSYTLPVVIDPAGNNHLPSITLASGPFTLEMPMLVRPELSGWANASLPAAEGQAWVGLGVDPAADLASQCPVMTRDSYSLMTLVQLDLSARPNACENCDLAGFVCYASTPTGLQASGLTFGAHTCLGPSETTLTKPGNWAFYDTSLAFHANPGEPLALHYTVSNYDTAAHTFNIASTSSTLNGAGWSLHPGQAGNPGEPDLTQTIDGPFEVPASGAFHIHILGTVPPGTASGSYTYRMTVSGSGVTPAELNGSSLLIITADGLPDAEDPQPGVSLAGSAGAGMAAAGANITYTFTLRNSGAQTLTSLALTDSLPANTTFVSCAGGDNCAVSGGTVTWNLASLGVNQVHPLTLVVQVNPGTPSGTVILNNAYSVTTAESAAASGAPIQVTVGTEFKVFIPVLRK